jgi:hypothetical protein
MAQGGSGDKAAREEAKRQRRAARKAEEAAARHRQARVRRLRTRGFALLALVVLGVGAYFVFRPGKELDGVEKPPDRGRRHLDAGEGFDYGDAAPTSGPHGPASRCGAFTEQVPLTALVHALEHGAVAMWYRPDVEDEVRPRLLRIMGRYDSHVIVSPNPGIEEPIVTTAWNRRMRFDRADDPVLAEFVETYRKRGPEGIPCPIT